MEVRHSEEHYFHRHQGLPAGLQILLSGGEECEGADVVGDGEAVCRLCAGICPKSLMPIQSLTKLLFPK